MTDEQIINLAGKHFLVPGATLHRDDLINFSRSLLGDTNAPEVKHYSDGTVATGPGPLPKQSPAQQDAEVG